MLFVVCQCLSYLYCNGLVSIRCNSWKTVNGRKHLLQFVHQMIYEYKNGHPKKNVLLRWISKPNDSSCRILVLLPIVLLKFMGGSFPDGYANLQLNRNPSKPHRTCCCCVFFALGITFLALPDGIPKAKIQFLQPLGRKEGPSNMTQKTVVLTKRITPLELYRYREIAWHNPLDAAPPSHLRRLDAYSARTPKAMV